MRRIDMGEGCILAPPYRMRQNASYRPARAIAVEIDHHEFASPRANTNWLLLPPPALLGLINAFHCAYSDFGYRLIPSRGVVRGNGMTTSRYCGTFMIGVCKVLPNGGSSGAN